MAPNSGGSTLQVQHILQNRPVLLLDGEAGLAFSTGGDEVGAVQHGDEGVRSFHGGSQTAANVVRGYRAIEQDDSERITVLLR